MEKNYRSILKNLPYQAWLDRVVNATRSKASTICELADSQSGCLRLVPVPLSPLAYHWLGDGLGGSQVCTAGEISACRREFAVKLFADGSFVMKYICDDGSVEKVDCASYSAMKIAYLEQKMRFDAWVKESNAPKKVTKDVFRKLKRCLTPANGYAIDRGAVYTSVMLDGEPFVGLFVSVSGAQDGKVDEECALVGMKAGQDFLTNINEIPEFSLGEQLNFSCSHVFTIM